MVRQKFLSHSCRDVSLCACGLHVVLTWSVAHGGEAQGGSARCPTPRDIAPTPFYVHAPSRALVATRGWFVEAGTGRRSLLTVGGDMLVAATLGFAPSTQQQLNTGVRYAVSNPLDPKFNAVGYGFRGKYFEVNSPKIVSQYSQVFWPPGGMPTVPLPVEIVQMFDNKTMFITGWEVDVWRDSASGPVSVPCYESYNHHYVSYLKGKGADLEVRPRDPVEAPGPYGHGGPQHLSVIKKCPHSQPMRQPTAPRSSLTCSGQSSGPECPRRSDDAEARLCWRFGTGPSLSDFTPLHHLGTSSALMARGPARGRPPRLSRSTMATSIGRATTRWPMVSALR